MDPFCKGELHYCFELRPFFKIKNMVKDHLKQYFKNIFNLYLIKLNLHFFRSYYTKQTRMCFALIYNQKLKIKISNL